MDSILFHAKRKKDDLVPTFTARFAKVEGDDSALLCVVSKPHPQLESYRRKSGDEITRGKLQRLRQEFATDGALEIVNVTRKGQLGRFLPNGTGSMLYFYAQRAARYFKISGNPKIFIRGTKLRWNPTQLQKLDTNLRFNVDKETVLISTTLSNIVPPKNETKTKKAD